METAASLIPRDPRDNQAQPGVDGNVSFVKRYAAALHHIRLRATLKRWPRSQGCAPARGTAARVGLCVALCSGRHNAQRSTAIVLPGGDKSIIPELNLAQVRVSGIGGSMREALLVNPFNSKQGPAQLANRRVSRSTPVCSNCESDNVVSYAVTQWSNESQEWQLASTFDQPTHCNRCNGPCDLVWLPLN
jgi:hypothetical protein